VLLACRPTPPCWAIFGPTFNTILRPRQTA
jgi:hypothetical protein